MLLRDPNLTARVLKLANSASYGLMSRVDTVARAVTVLGLAEIQKLVVTVSAVQNFSRLAASITNMNTFWRHAVYTGFLAQAIARRAGVLHPERLFVAGTLHDIGTLLINRHFPKSPNTPSAKRPATRTACSVPNNATSARPRLPRRPHARRLGPATGVVRGRALAPPATRARLAPLEAAILMVADSIANYSGTGSHSELVAEEDRHDVRQLERFGVTLSCSNDEIMDEVDEQFVETLYLLLG